MTPTREPARSPLILVAPTAFKGTLSASRAAAAMAAGVRDACPHADVVEMPVSDGGPGLLEALRARLGGTMDTAQVRDPLGRPAIGRVLRLSIADRRVAAVECADACGLHLLGESERDPLRATSMGVGDLLVAAARGADTVVLGLGGSATIDGGAGMASALGWRLLDREGEAIASGAAGLRRLARMVPPERRAFAAEVLALADVASPLLGPSGAAAVFGPQKGAAPEDIPILEEGLATLARGIRRDLSKQVEAGSGGGAAGGLGAGVSAFLDADLIPGAAWVLSAIDFDGVLGRARLVVTGEGSWDEQSSMGKITGVVIERSGRADVPVLLVAGRVSAATPPHVTSATGTNGSILGESELRRITAHAVARATPELGC